MLIFATFLGILFAPIFTFSCVLTYYEHPVLGFIAFLISLLVGLGNRATSL